MPGFPKETCEPRFVFEGEGWNKKDAEARACEAGLLKEEFINAQIWK
jgi:hypothetical protein